MAMAPLNSLPEERKYTPLLAVTRAPWRPICWITNAPFTQDGDLCATFERPKNGQDAQWSPNPRKSCFCVTAPATREAEASPRLTGKFAAERIDYLATIGRPLSLHSATTAMLVPPFCNHGNACASLLPPLSHL